MMVLVEMDLMPSLHLKGYLRIFLYISYIFLTSGKKHPACHTSLFNYQGQPWLHGEMTWEKILRCAGWVHLGDELLASSPPLRFNTLWFAGQNMLKEKVTPKNRKPPNCCKSKWWETHPMEKPNPGNNKIIKQKTRNPSLRGRFPY